MGFRRIVATIVSLIIFLMIVIVITGAGSMEGYIDKIIWPVIFAVILSTTLFFYGVSGSKSRQQDEVTKEAITRLETSIGELRKQMDEMHEYIADMYIRYDAEVPTPK